MFYWKEGNFVFKPSHHIVSSRQVRKNTIQNVSFKRKNIKMSVSTIVGHGDTRLLNIGTMLNEVFSTFLIGLFTIQEFKITTGK